MNVSLRKCDLNNQIPSMKKRTTLFQIEPVGIGTEYTESFTSYICRLAKTHSVYVVDLLKEMGLRIPMYNKYIKKHFGCFSRNSKMLNGSKESVLYYVEVFQDLSGINDLRFLTLATWSEVLVMKTMLKNNKSWCPLCLDEWQKKTVFEPLIWSFEPLKFCNLHMTSLEEYCPNCLKSHPPLTQKIQLGYCPFCNKWLGSSRKKEITLTKNELNWQKWVFNNLGDLIARTPSLSFYPTKEILFRNIKDVINKQYDGNLKSFGEALNKTRCSLSGWEKESNLPVINSLLQICFLADIKLFDFLTRENVVRGRTQNMKKIFNFHFPSEPQKPKKYFKNDINEQEKTRRNLKDIIQNEEPMSIAQVIKKLNFSRSTLKKYFPEEYKWIIELYQERKKINTEKRNEILKREIKQKVLELHEQGVYPSCYKINDMCSIKSAVKNPVGFAAWKDAIKNLKL